MKDPLFGPLCPPVSAQSEAFGRGVAQTFLALVLAVLTFGIGGKSEADVSRANAANVVRLTVRTPHSGFNRLVVSVTVCVPGTDRCATVDDVMLDTGSTGLRLEASALPAWLRLPPFVGPDRRPLAECLRFVDDDAWGPLVRADLRMGGLMAAELPLQIIGDEAQPQPDTCPHSDVRPTSNGTLGIGPELTDCRGDCEQSATFPIVFTCESGACLPLQGRIDPRYRLPNPVSLFPEHNNGVVFDLPSAPPAGADQLVGTLTFGVGTSANNQLGPAHLLRLSEAGRFTTLYDGASYPESYIDSGTETYVLPDDRLSRCDGMGGAFCVTPDRDLGAVMVGRDGTDIPMPFRVGNYRSIRERRFGASDSIAVAASPFSRAFVWGAPFFLGKRVSVVMDGKAVPGADGVRGPLYGIR